MRRKGFTFWELIIVLVVLLILAAILFPMFGRARSSDSGPSCQSRLKQIGLGFYQYVQDYSQQFPLTNYGKQGWMDAIMPYMKNTEIFQCPSDKAGRVLGTTDYFYNSRLAGTFMTRLKFPANTIMNGDGLSDSPTNISYLALPPTWATDSSSPAYRHLDGSNYSFADGHVKWLKPNAVTNKKASSTVTTFSPW